MKVQVIATLHGIELERKTFEKPTYSDVYLTLLRLGYRPGWPLFTPSLDKIKFQEPKEVCITLTAEDPDGDETMVTCGISTFESVNADLVALMQSGQVGHKRIESLGEFEVFLKEAYDIFF